MQLKIFLICFAVGFSSGIIYEIFYVILSIVGGVSKKAVKIITPVFDVLYFIILSALFIFSSVAFSFYKIRAYMLVSCLLGALLYYKTLHLRIAIFVNMVYNKINQKKEK